MRWRIAATLSARSSSASTARVARATDRGSATRERRREPNAEERRENLTFALATRAVEALEDLALNVAAIRQRLERTAPAEPGPRPREDDAGQA